MEEASYGRRSQHASTATLDSNCRCWAHVEEAAARVAAARAVQPPCADLHSTETYCDSCACVLFACINCLALQQHMAGARHVKFKRNETRHQGWSHSAQRAPPFSQCIGKLCRRAEGEATRHMGVVHSSIPWQHSPKIEDLSSLNALVTISFQRYSSCDITS